MCNMHEVIANSSKVTMLSPESRGGCVGGRLPAQTLGEELGEGGGRGPGSRGGGGACTRCMVRASLAHWGADTQLDQEAKELGQSSAQTR